MALAAVTALAWCGAVAERCRFRWGTGGGCALGHHLVRLRQEAVPDLT